MSQRLVVLYNPVSGNGTASSFFQEQVLPLLSRHGRQPNRVIETQNAEHAGSALLEYLETLREDDTGKSSAGDPKDVTLILGSGDGTLHDMVNYLSLNATADVPRIHIALIPCGTANALYSAYFPPSSEAEITEPAYKLRSLQAYLDSKPPAPLNLAVTVISPPPSPGQHASPYQTTLSTVVISTSMHALILRDSEALRKEMPGIERFKAAAKKNSTRWYMSSLKLYPTSNQQAVEVYDLQSKTFTPHPDAIEHDPLDLEGPFIYFLSTVNVDRLEPAFRITPLASSIPPTEAMFDVVVIRPLRDPSTPWNSDDAREAFVSKLWSVLGGAYQDGKHIALRYNEQGALVSDGEGESVVEYLRCGGWEWTPFDIDDNAHTICADGTIFTIPPGGRATCTAATPRADGGFTLYS